VTDYLVRVLPKSCQLEVELTVRSLPKGPVRFELPTWVPGAYAFMRYARNLYDVKAREPKSGRALPVRRSGWSGFEVVEADGEVTLSYRVHGYDPAWGEMVGVVQHDQAVILGTHYLYAVGQLGPRTVRYEVPTGWKVHHPAGAETVGANAWRYPSYHALLDTPVVMGQFELVTRTWQGTPFHHVFLDRAVGYERELDGFVDSLMKVVESARDVFGSFPFEHYTFIFTFDSKSGWGLEHASSTMIALSEHALIDPDERARGIRVAAHELFHAWNVCRLRPAPFMKMEYAAGSFTDGLWVSEGFTRYYEFLLSVRSQAISVETFFSNVVNYYRHLVAMPAYRRTTAVDSSLATFLNHSRYPGNINNSIDYYDKGMLIAFDLDAELRRLDPPTSLDREFRGFYEAFVGKGDGFTQSDVRRFFGRHGAPIAELISREVEGEGGLSVPEQLEQLGFGLESEKVRYLGIVLDKNQGPAVNNVLDDGPAGKSGLAAGDELLRVNGFAFDLASLKWLIAHEPKLTLEVKRAHRFFTFEIETGEREQLSSLRWTGSDLQAHAIRQWLGREDFKPTPGQHLPLGSFENFHGIQTVL
jgi:predicted metalloprotease with PDZ domain